MNYKVVNTTLNAKQLIFRVGGVKVQVILFVK